MGAERSPRQLEQVAVELDLVVNLGPLALRPYNLLANTSVLPSPPRIRLTTYLLFFEPRDLHHLLRHLRTRQKRKFFPLNEHLPSLEINDHLDAPLDVSILIIPRARRCGYCLLGSISVRWSDERDELHLDRVARESEGEVDASGEVSRGEGCGIEDAQIALLQRVTF